MRVTAIPHRAYVAARRAWARRQGDQRLRRMYGLTTRPGDLVFDVGANIGDHVALFRSMGFRVVAVEPQPALVAALSERYASDSDVVVVARALSDSPGTGALQLNSSHVIASMSHEFRDATHRSGRFGAAEWTEVIEVETTTLDELIAAHGRPALCKIDVEGFERVVLDGLSQPLSAVVFEYTGEVISTAADCVERLGELGFRSFALWPPDRYRTPREWLSAAEMTSAVRSLPVSAGGDLFARLS
jgi:FkbM family methyltransferase